MMGENSNLATVESHGAQTSDGLSVINWHLFGESQALGKGGGYPHLILHKGPNKKVRVTVVNSDGLPDSKLSLSDLFKLTESLQNNRPGLLDAIDVELAVR